MLIPDNIHPERTIYYNGSFVLKAIQDNPVMSVLDLYIETTTAHKMSMPVFILCLDWLFLLELVRLNDLGEVELCS